MAELVALSVTMKAAGDEDLMRLRLPIAGQPVGVSVEGSGATGSPTGGGGLGDRGNIGRDRQCDHEQLAGRLAEPSSGWGSQPGGAERRCLAWGSSVLERRHYADAQPDCFALDGAVRPGGCQERCRRVAPR